MAPRKSNPRRPRRRSTAFHEAGHAVMSWLLGVRFRAVTTKPDGESLGNVTMRTRMRTEPSDQSLERQAQIELAGAIAQKLCTGRMTTRWGSSHDDQNAVTLAMKRCGSGESATAWLRWLSIRVRDCLSTPRNLSAVKAVAEALLERETLNEDETLKIMNSALRTRIDDPVATSL